MPNAFEASSEIETIKTQIEPASATAKRSWRLARSTVLMAGGLFGATIEIWTVVLSILGLWDWIDAVVEDNAAANNQLRMKQQMVDLEFDLAALTLEVRRRTPQSDRNA